MFFLDIGIQVFKQLNIPKLLDSNQPRAQTIIDVVAVIGYFVTEVGQLCL